MASSSTFTPILTATPSAPPTYNVGMAETFSWIPVEGAGRPLFARATYLANPEDIKISLSATNINVSLDELELNTDNIEELVDITNNSLTAFKLETDINFERTNTLLEVLTSTQHESVSLLHALTANTDDLEELVIENNTLLNSLTALTQSEFNETQTLLTNEFHSLTALTQSEFDETQTLLASEFHSLTALTQSEFDETQTLLSAFKLEVKTEFDETETLLALLTAQSDEVINLLTTLSAHTDQLENLCTDVNTNLVTIQDQLSSEFNETQTLLTNEFHSLTALTQSEFNKTQTLLDSLTALTESEFNETQTLLTNKLNSLTSITQSEFDETQTLLDSLTALQEDKQSQIITLLHQLTANTDEIEINLDNLEINTDGVEFLLSGTNSLLSTLTAVDYATATKQDSIITLLHQLTANTDELEINTDELETLINSLTALTQSEFNESQTLLDSLTAITQSEFDETQNLLTSKFDSLTSITQSESNETQTLLDSLTALQEDKQNQIITLLHQLTANTDGVETLLNSLTALTEFEFNETQTLLNSLTALQESKQNDIITLLNQLTANTDSLEVNTDEVELLLSGTNVLLNALTAVDYSTATKQDVIITLLDSLTAKETTISLDVSAINLNTDQIEGLIQTSNTLLDALTAKQTLTDVTGLETRLDVLTAVDYATSTKQDESNSLLSGLTAIQLDKQDQIITLLHAITGTAIEIDLNADQIDLHVDDVETLLHDLTASNIKVPGFSIPPYDEISLAYYGSTNNLLNVIYKNNTTDVLSLSFVYIPNPPTSNDALLASIKKI